MPHLPALVRTLPALFLLVLAPDPARATEGGVGAAGRRLGVEASGTMALGEGGGGRVGLVIVRNRARIVFEGEGMRARAFHSGAEPHSGIGSTAARVVWMLEPARGVELHAGAGARLLGLFRPDTDRFTFLPEATGRLGARVDLAGPLGALASLELGLPAALVDARAGLDLRLGSVDLGVRWREYHRRWWRTFRPEWEMRGVEVALAWIPGRAVRP